MSREEIEYKLQRLGELRELLLEKDRLKAPSGPEYHLEPHQIAPEGDWWLWLLFAGRGSGKTQAGSHFVTEHVLGLPCYPSIPGGHRVAIIAPTLGDAVEACVRGPSGIKTLHPSVRMIQRAGGTDLEWPNGSVARLFGAFTPEDVERLRAGGNRCLVWAEELAAWRQLEDAWYHMELGLRLGKNPRVIGTTTPKNRKKIKELLKDPKTFVTPATTEQNPHLDTEVKARLYERYAGTRLGRQELLGELLEDVEGALWTQEMIEAYRVKQAPELVRIVVAVDPSWGVHGAECGIVVAGVGHDKRGYVLEDASIRATPAQWGQRVKEAYLEWKADRIVAETNFQAEQVRLVMKSVDPQLPFKELRASRGKAQRAEPIVGLYEQGKVSHVGTHAKLEQQLTEWVPPPGIGASDFSPDRLDALVWALTELMVTGASSEAQVHSAAQTQLRRRAT